MVYVVERYLPGLSRADLLPRLARLEPVLEELRAEGSAVRYLGSAIVLEDEACFCQFDGSSVAAVAEANRRAGLPFDRIVPAVLVQPTPRSNDVSISTSFPKPVGVRHSPHLAAIGAVVAVIALFAGAGIATRVSQSGTRPAPTAAPTQTSVLRSLTPRERQYVVGVLSLTPAESKAAFGTSPTSAPAAGSGTAPASTATTSPAVASPILPACGPQPCWRAATSAGRPVHSER
jgi:hypothetical protein